MQRAGAGGGAEEAWGLSVLGSLRWALVAHVETRRREARLAALEALLASYCHHQGERRRYSIYLLYW